MIKNREQELVTLFVNFILDVERHRRLDWKTSTEIRQYISKFLSNKGFSNTIKESVPKDIILKKPINKLVLDNPKKSV